MSKNLLKLLILLLFFNVIKVRAQEINLISDPNNFIQILSGKYITYKDHLYTGYTTSFGTSYLARLDSNKLTIIPNPEPTEGFAGALIVYNNKLYMRYKSYLSYQLAEYDGSTFKLIDNPTNGNGYMGRPIIYKNKLYIQYDSTNLSTFRQNVLAVFNGNNITIPQNLSSVKNAFGIPIIYNDKLYSIYSTNDLKYHLVAYDGNNFALIKNPDEGLGIQYNLTGLDSSRDVVPIIFKDKLITVYENLYQHFEIATYDGNVLSLVPNPNNAGRMDYINSIIYKNNLYLVYNDTASYTNGRIDKLCKYDGETLTIFNPPDSGSIVPDVSPIIYNDELYFVINTFSNIYGSKLAFFNEKTISSILDPAPNFEIYDLSLYANNLFLGYENINKTNLSKYDGTSISIINNVDDGLGFNGGSIAYNDTLFFIYNDVNYNDHLAYYLQKDVLAINIVNFNASLNNGQTMLTWQTQNKSNIKTFNVQRSLNGRDFNTINRIAAVNNNFLTESYRYIDINSGSLKVNKLFYRLQEINEDGLIDYTDIRQVIFPKNTSNFSISPNPVKDFINILSTEDKKNVHFIIYDATGKMLYQTNKNFTAGQQIRIPTGMFSTQLLLIKIITINSAEEFKVVLE